MTTDRLAQQMAFIIEIDRLKTIARRTLIADGSHYENSAEHSWHLAMAAMILAEQSDEMVDLPRVIMMLLIHDIVEIDAGDTFYYDDVGREDKAEREQRAADRIFGLLPDDQTFELRALWEEFEARETAEARFANALDRLMPLIHNTLNDGHTWRKNGISMEQVWVNTDIVERASIELADHMRELLLAAQAKGQFDGAYHGRGSD
jgi:putative hydrolases of HD superfamily